MSGHLFPVIILAGGLATRLRPLTKTIPKSLIPINGEPFINHQLRLLSEQGVHQVVICVGYLGEMIQQQVGDGQRFNLQVDYSYDGSTLRGTGGAIKQALPLLSDSFFVLYGDSYLVCDYVAIQSYFLMREKQSLMTVFCNQDKWDNSNIEYINGKIMAYNKKQRTERMQYLDYGLGILTKEAINSILDNEPYDLVSLYQKLLKNDQISVYEVTRRFYEIGSFAGIRELEYYLSGKC